MSQWSDIINAAAESAKCTKIQAVKAWKAAAESIAKDETKTRKWQINGLGTLEWKTPHQGIYIYKYHETFAAGDPPFYADHEVTQYYFYINVGGPEEDDPTLDYPFPGHNAIYNGDWSHYPELRKYDGVIPGDDFRTLTGESFNYPLWAVFWWSKEQAMEFLPVDAYGGDAPGGFYFFRQSLSPDWKPLGNSESTRVLRTKIRMTTHKGVIERHRAGNI